MSPTVHKTRAGWKVTLLNETDRDVVEFSGPNAEMLVKSYIDMYNRSFIDPLSDRQLAEN